MMAVYGRNMSWIEFKVTVTILCCIVMEIYMYVAEIIDIKATGCWNTIHCTSSFWIVKTCTKCILPAQLFKFTHKLHTKSYILIIKYISVPDKERFKHMVSVAQHNYILGVHNPKPKSWHSATWRSNVSSKQNRNSTNFVTFMLYLYPVPL